jgi:type IV secretory pathway VirB10-like protein
VAYDPKTNELSFSLPQILGGALAAATAAVIGSTLGVAGTVIGAALASVVGGVLGTLYTAGIHKTKRGIDHAVAKVISSGEAMAPDAQSLSAETKILPAVEPAGETEQLPAAPPETTAASEPGRGQRLVVRAVVATLAIFLIAFVAITSWELATGKTLSGSPGTTVGDVVDPSGNSEPEPEPSESPTLEPTPEESTPSPEPTPEEPTESPTLEPEPTPSESTAEPAPEPSEPDSVQDAGSGEA